MPHPPRPPTEWLDLHLHALFVHDERGRILTRNALERGPAPRFFLGRTPEGNRWRFRDDLPGDLVERLEALCAVEPPATDLSTPPRHEERYRELLAAHAPITETWSGPAYHFPEALPPATREVVRLTNENAGLLRGGDLEPWIEDIGQSEPLVALVRGFAVTVVAAWARAVREAGAEPLYSTSWENTASQAVAGKLGLIPYASDYWLA